MKTDFMVIGRVRNHANINTLIDQLETKGYSCFNFLNKPVLPEQSHLSWEEQMNIFESVEDFWNDKNYRFHFETDMNALKQSDTIILLLPAGKAAHMEAGAAYGLGKKLVIIGEIEKPETLYLMSDEHFASIEDFLATV